jgi:hypothetical protein
MKTSLLITLALTTAFAFIGTYFLHLTSDNIEQYLAVGLVIFADGFFGIWAGVKREGFQTRKALSVLKTFGFWIVMLSAILSIDFLLKSFVQYSNLITISLFSSPASSVRSNLDIFLSTFEKSPNSRSCEIK